MIFCQEEKIYPGAYGNLTMTFSYAIIIDIEKDLFAHVITNISNIDECIDYFQKRKLSIESINSALKAKYGFFN